MTDKPYPFGDTARALEQTGYLKAEVDHLRKDAVTKVDLERHKSEMMAFIRDIEDQRIKKTEAALDNWWRHKEASRDTAIAKAIADDRAKRQAERLRLLDEQGLEIGPDGKIKSKINPVRAFFVQNWFVLIGVAVATAIAQPEWFKYIWQPVIRVIF